MIDPYTPSADYFNMAMGKGLKRLCCVAINGQRNGMTDEVYRNNKLCGRPPQYAPAPATEARSGNQAGQAGPDEPIRAIPAGRPLMPPAGRMYATDVRQTSDSIIA